MKGKMIFINCKTAEGSTERKAARDYLVIPQTKRVYIVTPGEATARDVTAICRDIVRTETENFVVYVLTPRGSGLQETLREQFSGEPAVCPVVIGKKTETYLKAADVILTRASILTDPVDAAADVGDMLTTAYSKAYRSVSQAVLNAKLFLDTRCKTAGVHDAASDKFKRR